MADKYWLLCLDVGLLWGRGPQNLGLLGWPGRVRVDSISGFLRTAYKKRVLIG